MRQHKRNAGLLVASLLSVFTLAVAPVWAERGGSGQVNAESTTSTTEQQKTSDDATEHATTEAEQEDSVREQARSLLETERQNHKEKRTEAEKQKACENRQDSIDNRSANFAAAAQRHLDVFNSIFAKVQAFHDNNNLNVANYDALVATAKTKQATAQQAVDVLKGLSIKIDCTTTDPANTVATLKAAVKNARTALHDYRTSIKNVVVALQGASTSTEPTTTTGGNQ